MLCVIRMKAMLLLSALFLSVSLIMTACDTDDELVVETPAAPPSNSEGPGIDDDKMNRNITIRVGERSFSVTLEDNATGRAFSALLPMAVTMDELNGNEKYHYLSGSLPMDSYRPGTIFNGDLMLYGPDCLVLFYKTFTSSYNYSRIGRIDNPSGLADALGEGNVAISFAVR